MTGERIAERFRSTVTRRGDVVDKVYKRPDARNEVERSAYRHLAAFSAPVPRFVASNDDGIVLEYVDAVCDYDEALRSADAVAATRAVGRAYAALHAVPPAGPVTRVRLETEHLAAWCDAMHVAVPDLGDAIAAYDDPGEMLAFSHGDPAPSNTLLRADGAAVLVDFEYAGARHRGYHLAAWHVLCPLAPELLDALHDGYGREIEGLDALIVWRAVQVVGMNRTELLGADREFAPGWSARASLLTALRRGGEHEPGLLPLHDVLARRWPDSADRLPEWR
jgi:tRNA A-37 threonylcarbamoyl transferase component Bud32